MAIDISSTLNIVSFNVKIGGVEKANDEQAIKDISYIVSQGDIISLQEVTARAFPKAIFECLRSQGLNYHFVYADLPEGQDKEEAVWFYNLDKVLPEGYYVFPNSRPRLFRRAPALCIFQAAHKKIGVMDYHAEFGEGNSKELLKLPIAVDYFRRETGIENIIITADMNTGSDPTSNRFIEDVYFSRWGMAEPQAFPRPGVITTNGSNPATYDWMIWDGKELTPKRSEIIRYRDVSRLLLNTLLNDGSLGNVFPGARKKLRKNLIEVSDHWALSTEFYLGGDYTWKELNEMPLKNCIPLYLLRFARRLPGMGYDFPYNRIKDLPR